MSSPPPLTTEQKARLAELEPSLRRCVKLGALTSAKSIAGKIQQLLRPTGHETRLAQAKNWLFECALEAQDYEFAIRGFQSIRVRMAESTRTYLEATALLAVCHLRRGALYRARPLIEEALDRMRNITSDAKRQQFHARLRVTVKSGVWEEVRRLSC